MMSASMTVIDGTGVARLVSVGDTIHGWYEQSPAPYLAYCERALVTGYTQSPREKINELLNRLEHMKRISRQVLCGENYRVHAANSSAEVSAIADRLSRLSDDEAASQWREIAERLGLAVDRPIRCVNYGAGGETPASET